VTFGHVRTYFSAPPEKRTEAAWTAATNPLDLSSFSGDIEDLLRDVHEDDRATVKQFLTR
jgi:hypothetical protein